MLRLFYFLIFGRDMPPRREPCGHRYHAVQSVLRADGVVKMDCMGVCDARPSFECQDGYCVAHHKQRACTCEP